MKIIEVCVTPERFAAMEAIPWLAAALGLGVGLVVGVAIAIFIGMRQTRRLLLNF